MNQWLLFFGCLHLYPNLHLQLLFLHPYLCHYLSFKAYSNFIFVPKKTFPTFKSHYNLKASPFLNSFKYINSKCLLPLPFTSLSHSSFHSLFISFYSFKCNSSKKAYIFKTCCYLFFYFSDTTKVKVAVKKHHHMINTHLNY